MLLRSSACLAYMEEMGRSVRAEAKRVGVMGVVWADMFGFNDGRVWREKWWLASSARLCGRSSRAVWWSRSVVIVTCLFLRLEAAYGALLLGVLKIRGFKNLYRRALLVRELNRMR